MTFNECSGHRKIQTNFGQLHIKSNEIYVGKKKFREKKDINMSVKECYSTLNRLIEVLIE